MDDGNEIPVELTSFPRRHQCIVPRTVAAQFAVPLEAPARLKPRCQLSLLSHLDDQCWQHENSIDLERAARQAASHLRWLIATESIPPEVMAAPLGTIGAVAPSKPFEITVRTCNGLRAAGALVSYAALAELTISEFLEQHYVGAASLLDLLSSLEQHSESHSPASVPLPVRYRVSSFPRPGYAIVPHVLREHVDVSACGPAPDHGRSHESSAWSEDSETVLAQVSAAAKQLQNRKETSDFVTGIGLTQLGEIGLVSLG